MDVHPPSPSVATTLKGSELPSAMWSPTCPTKIGDALRLGGPTQPNIVGGAQVPAS